MVEASTIGVWCSCFLSNLLNLFRHSYYELFILWVFFTMQTLFIHLISVHSNSFLHQDFSVTNASFSQLYKTHSTFVHFGLYHFHSCTGQRIFFCPLWLYFFDSFKVSLINVTTIGNMLLQHEKAFNIWIVEC